ncbi:site-specific integrase [Leeuwenhoekiella aequorea]|uniref:Site-specific recombinase XerD n=1 Tax=Leeuwenhoekiella aequorea TaxID=283736 RepID=A0A4Q0P5U1_9FLAO|nr:site-specific integrase [Leeuwenhoekiella aequorea]RXG21426.1 site-specific recombinase XerD [Leeuwenhoekiella aequorea]
MMASSISILFYPTSAKKSLKAATIYARITVDSKRSEFSTQHKATEKWDPKLGKMTGTSAEARMVNRHLDDVRTKIYEIYDRLIREDKPVSAQIIRDIYQGKDDEQRMLLELFKEHNDRIESLIGKGYSNGTLQRYKAARTHLENYLLFLKKKNDIALREIDYQFISGFEHYLKSQKNCAHNTATKYIVNFKKIMRIALANQFIDKDPFFHWKSNWKTKEREFLTSTELNTLAQKEFSIVRLEQVRDIFLFCCFTGLAYADVNKLSSDDIILGLNGERWIKTKRQKTNTLSSIPILPTAEQILNKYSDHPCRLKDNKLLPVLTNQKSNAYLKEIADVCGISKTLTTHLARHTFATTVTLSRGVPMETVSKMLGHTSIKTTQLYAKVLDSKIGADMDLLKKQAPILKE